MVMCLSDMIRQNLRWTLFKNKRMCWSDKSAVENCLKMLGHSSAPGPSTCLMHPTWAGDLFHYR